MHRWEHHITPARGDRYPGRVIALDCDAAVSESPGRPVVQQETLTGWASWSATGRGGAYGRPAYVGGQDEDSLWAVLAHLSRRPGVVWVMSYRALRVLSLAGLWERLERGEAALVGRGKWRQRQRRKRRDGEPSGYLVVEDPPTCLRLRLPGCRGSVQWVDLRNYGSLAPPAGLDAAGRARWVLDWWLRALDWTRERGWGTWQPTAGAQAAYTWRRAHYTEPVLCHNHPPTLRLERDSYHGGRTEAFRLGRCPGLCVYLDCRALYPWLCANCYLPSALLGYTDTPQTAAPVTPHWWANRIADVVLETTEPAYPYVRDGLVVWPVGRFRTVLCGPELVDAWQQRRVVAVLRWAEYQMGWPLRSLSAALLASRRQAERENWPAGATWLKALAVALPGRLGQSAHRWEPCAWREESHPWCLWWQKCADGVSRRHRSVAGAVQVEYAGEWAEHSVPQIASWVCSLGRRWLLDRIREAGWEHVFYAATDGLWVDEHGGDNLVAAGWVAPDRDGGLRLKHPFTTLRIHGVNDWEAGPVVCRAGQPKGEETEGVVGAGAWRREGLPSACANGHAPGGVRALVEYTRAGVYRHGVVLPTGEVAPHKIWED